MKRVRQYKGLVIKQITDKERQSGLYSSEYYIFTRDNDIEWECDSIEECIEWIDCY